MKTIVLLILAVGLLSTSCQKEMEQTTLNFALEEYDTLTLKSVFNVELIQGTENKIEIHGAKKIVEKIDFKLQNNTLTLTNTFKGNWVHPKKNKITITLTTNGLNRINSHETCNIKTLNTLVSPDFGLIMTSKLNEATLDLNCDTFYYWNNFPCGGKINLSGATNELLLWNVALMSIDAKNMIANNVLIENASKGHVKVNCLQRLTYKISGEGNVYLTGNPTELIKIEESSTGKLIYE